MLSAKSHTKNSVPAVNLSRKEWEKKVFQEGAQSGTQTTGASVSVYHRVRREGQLHFSCSEMLLPWPWQEKRGRGGLHVRPDASDRETEHTGFGVNSCLMGGHRGKSDSCSQCWGRAMVLDPDSRGFNF